MIAGALVLPLEMIGMIEASATRRPIDAAHFQPAVDAPPYASLPILQVPTGMERGRAGAQPVEKLGVALDRGARRELSAAIGSKALLRHHVAHHAHAGDRRAPDRTRS